MIPSSRLGWIPLAVLGGVLGSGCGLLLDPTPARDAATSDAGPFDSGAADAAPVDADAPPDAGAPGSCAELLAQNPALPDGDYVIEVDGLQVTVTCDMSSEGGGWTEVVDLLPSRDGCGDGLAFDEEVQACHVPSPSCAGEIHSLRVPVPLAEWSEIRGYVRGYQFQTTDAFESASAATLDDAYVDGISITTGSPRRHLWTFAAGLLKPAGSNPNSCPCDGGPAPPSFVADQWTCETGNDRDVYDADPRWYGADLLWDADGDAHQAMCAPVRDPGWFQATLASPSADDVEVRILFDQCDENIGLAALRLFVR